MPGEIILERRARSNRNAGRDHRGFAGDFPRNPQSVQPHNKIVASRTCPQGLATRFLTASGVLAISLRYRNSPARPPSATATAFLSFAVSKAMKGSLCPSIGSSAVLGIRLGPSEQSSMLVHNTTGRLARRLEILDDANTLPRTPQGL